MSKRTIADLIIDALADHGVRQVWGVVGDALNPVTDAIRREDRIEWIGVRHEEVGAFAASAQAQLTGDLGGVHGHGRPGCDPPAQRAVRRQQVARPGPGHLRAGAAGGDRQRLLPGGRQRRAVRRRGGASTRRSPRSTSCRRCSSRRSTRRSPSGASPCSASRGTWVACTCPRTRRRRGSCPPRRPRQPRPTRSATRRRS